MSEPAFPAQSEMVAERVAVSQLGLPGLPAPVSTLASGGIYALEVESLPVRMSLIIESLRANLVRDVACALITSLPLGKLLARARELGVGVLEDAARRGQLRLFASIGDYTKNIFRYGSQRFLAELEQQQIWLDHFIVFDQAENLFTLHDETLVQEQARIYHHWMRDHHHTALFMFVHPQGNGPVLGEQHGLLSYMNGCARLTPVRDRLAFDIQFWRSPAGTVMGMAFQFAFSPQGRLMSVAEAPAKSTDSREPADGDDVYYMDADLGGCAESRPGTRWILADSLIGMLHATREARAATVVLRFGHDTSLQQLAEAVHTLRHNLGSHLRIVIRESSASLRYPNELLLLRLGANLVIHRDTPPARLMLSLESLRGQIFARAMDVPFKEALASVTPSRLSGAAVSGPLFCEEVGLALSRAAVLGVPYTLVVARCKPSDKTIDDVAEQFNLNRNGDVLTLHGEYCLLFLHACPGDNARATFARLLESPVEHLFATVEYHSTETTVLAELEKLNLVATSPRPGPGDIRAGTNPVHPAGDATSTSKKGPHGRKAQVRSNSTA